MFRDDHRLKQPENFKLKRNGFFSSFIFATVLVAFIGLEGNGSRAVQIHSQYILNIITFLFVIIKDSRLSHDVVAYDVDRDVSTAYC